MTILPGETACLRCLMSEAPPPGTTPTCDTAGILAPIILDRFGRDPAVSSSVVVTFMCDFFGFLALLGIAALILL